MLSGDSKFPSSGVFNDDHAEIYARGPRAVLEVVEASGRCNRRSETLRDIYAGGRDTRVQGGCYELLKSLRRKRQISYVFFFSKEFK